LGNNCEGNNYLNFGEIYFLTPKVALFKIETILAIKPSIEKEYSYSEKRNVTLVFWARDPGVTRFVL